MKKSLMNRIFHKIKLFGFKMQDEMSLDKNLDEFNKIVIDLKIQEKKVDDVNQVVILQSSKRHYQMSKDSLTMEKLEPVIRSKVWNYGLKRRIVLLEVVMKV